MYEAISSVRRAIEAGALLPDGATVVVAVSGGIDSIVLLDILQRLAPRKRWRLVVAHLDHGLRGKHSKADARFVRDEAKARGLEVRLGSADVAARKAREKGGLAAVARAVRYEFFAAVAREARDPSGRKPVCVATAHTASDQAETFLLRVLRGAGGTGLGGIPPRRRLLAGVFVVRPMLGLTRDDVRVHAARFDLHWREDPTNESRARARNRVRHDVLPVLVALQPEAERLLARAATRAAEVDRIVTRAGARAFRKVAQTAANGLVLLDRKAWAALPPEEGALVVRRALLHARGPKGLSSAHVEAVCAISRVGHGRAVLAGAIVEADRDTVVVERAAIPGVRDPGKP